MAECFWQALYKVTTWCVGAGAVPVEPALLPAGYSFVAIASSQTSVIAIAQDDSVWKNSADLTAGWTQCTIPYSGGDIPQLIAYDGTHFVAAGNYNPSSFTMYSADDGDTWVAGGVIGGDNDWFEAVNNDGTIVLTGRDVTGFSSDHGVNWTVKNYTGYWDSIAASGSTIIKARFGSSATAVSTDNGTNFSTLSIGGNLSWPSVVTNGSCFIKLDPAGNSARSDMNGANWEIISTPAGKSIEALSTGRFVIMTLAGVIWYSDDNGDSWYDSTLDFAMSSIDQYGSCAYNESFHCIDVYDTAGKIGGVAY